MDEKIREAIAAELQVPLTELTTQRDLASFEMWDSVTALTVTVLLSDALGLPVEPGEISELKTFGDIEALVRSKRK